MLWFGRCSQSVEVSLSQSSLTIPRQRLVLALMIIWFESEALSDCFGLEDVLSKLIGAKGACNSLQIDVIKLDVGEQLWNWRKKSNVHL